jgi:hypothetical protein
MEVITMMSLLRALHVHAAERGDGLLPEFLNCGRIARSLQKPANEDTRIAVRRAARRDKSRAPLSVKNGEKMPAGR